MSSAILSLLVALAADGAGAERVRVEPQIGPYQPQKVQFHPTERWHLLVVEGDGKVGVWDMEDKENYRRLLTIYTNAADATFTADGAAIVTAGGDGRLRRWDLDGALEWETNERHDGRATSVASSPFGEVLASGGSDGAVRLWSLDGSARSKPLRGHEGSVLSVAFSPVGEVLASSGSDGAVRLWNLDGTAHGEPLRGHDASRSDWFGGVNSVAFSPSGDLLASGGSEGTIRLWNVNGEARGEPLRGHETAGLSGLGGVRSVAFSPSGEVLASSGSDGTVRLWNLDGSARGKPFQGQKPAHMFEPYGVQSVAFSPTGEVLASSGSDGTIRLWNLDGSARGTPLSGHKEADKHGLGGVWTVAFSPIKEVLASGGSDGTIRLWNLDGSALGELVRGNMRTGSYWLAGISSLAFSPSGNVLAAGSSDGKVRLWDLDGKAVSRPLRGHVGRVSSVAFSPTGEMLASGGLDGKVWLWNLDGSARGEPLRGHKGGVLSVAFSTSGKVLASGGLDGTVRLWDLDSSTQIRVLSGHMGGVSSVAISAADNMASGGLDGTVRLWNLDGSARGEPMRGHEVTGEEPYWLGGVSSVTFSPSGKTLASSGSDGTIRLWNLNGGALGEPLRVQGNPLDPNMRRVNSVAFSPRGDLLASGGADGTVRLWNLDGSARGEPLCGDSNSATSIAISPSAEILALGSSEGTIRIWSLDGSAIGGPLHSSHSEDTWNSDGVWAVAFSPTASVLASGGEDGMRLWESDGTVRSEPSLGRSSMVGIRSVAFSPSGEVLASGGKDGTVRLWNLDGSTRGEPLRGHEAVSRQNAFRIVFSSAGEVLERGGSVQIHRVNSVVFSPSGNVLASGGVDGAVRLWNLDGSALGEPLRGHEGGVNSVTFSPGGAVLASGGSDGTVRLWNLRGTPRGEPLRGHIGAVRSVAFSSSGKVLASGGSDGTIRLWNTTADKVAELDELVTPDPVAVGFFANELWSLSRSGLLTFFDGNLRPAARMSPTPEGTIVFTPEGWFCGDSRVLGFVEHYSGQSRFPLSRMDAFKKYYQPEKVVATIRGRSVWDVLWATARRLWRETKTWYAELDWKAKLAFWPTAAYLTLLLGVAATWLFRPAALAARAMLSLTDPDPPGWTLALQWASLVRWLGRTRRPLDAWLRRYGEALVASTFADKDPVRYRRLYVDLDNESGSAAWRASADAGRPESCWITGPGGCGKSTLAFHLARQLRDGSGRRPLLPVLVDKDWHGPLLDEIGRQLEVDSRRPDAWTVRKLVHTGRLAVIVDGLSERRAEGGEASVLELRDASPRYLFVTSRASESPGEGFHKIELGPLADDRLPAFVGAYVTGDEAGELVAALRRFTRGEPIRPLFARLAVEQLREGRGLPSSYALLVDGYVRGLRPQGAGALSEDDFLGAARVAAEACVETDLAPRAVDVAYLRARLRRDREKLPFCDAAGAELAPESVLAQLLECGLLEKVGSLGENRVQFADDPVAEYLMAMSVDHQRTSEWARRLKRELKKAGEKARGLADALADVEASG